MADRRRDHGRRTCARSAATVAVDGDDARPSPRRPGVPTSPTPTTWSRRSPGSSATTRSRRCCRPRPPGRGLTRPQKLRRRVGRTLAGAGLRRGDQLPVRRRRATSTRSACPPTTRCAARSRLANPLSERGAGADHDAAARPAQDRGPQRRPRAAPTSRCSRPAPVFFPADRRPGADPRRRPAARPTAELDELTRRVPDQPLHLAVVARRRARAAGWWGAGPRGRLGRRRRGGPRRRRGARRRGRGRAGRPGALAPGPLRRDAGRRQPVRPRRRAAPAGVRGLRRCRRAPRPPRSTSTLLIARAPRCRAGAGVLDATRSPRRTSRCRRRGRRRPATSTARCARAPARCWSRCGSSTSTPARRSGRARSRWRSRCASGPPTARSPRRRPRRPGTPRWPLAVQRYGAVHRA